MAPPGLELRDIHRTFFQGEARLEVLRGASVSVAAGELVALVGPSGSGKSTLLHIAGLLEPADQGEVSIGGQPCGAMSERERTLTRRGGLGFVYQFHHLLPEFSALENVMLPQMIAGVRRAAARIKANELLDRLGLAERASHRPARLSGGEQQRVALARAMANAPGVLLAMSWVSAIGVLLIVTAGFLAVREARLANPERAGRLALPILTLAWCFGLIIFGWGFAA